MLYVFQKCFYCYAMVKDTDKWGVCVQCSAGRCTTSFHVTCAMAAEVLFETSDWPNLVYITCNKHTANKGKVWHSCKRLNKRFRTGCTRKLYLCDIKMAFYFYLLHHIKVCNVQYSYNYGLLLFLGYVTIPPGLVLASVNTPLSKCDIMKILPLKRCNIHALSACRQVSATWGSWRLGWMCMPNTRMAATMRVMWRR